MRFPTTGTWHMSARNHQQGIALILVVWVVALISGIALAFARTQKVEGELAQNQRLIAQARALAEAGIHRAYYDLQTPSLDPNRWQANGAKLVWETDNAKVEIRALDESARVDINTGNPQLIQGLLKNAGATEEQALAISEAMQDWRDQDDLKRPNGAEAEDYKAAGKKALPTNTDFVSVSELQNVLGVTPELFRAIEPFLTVNSRQSGVSIALAPREVLLAIPNITAENVDLYLTTRRDALAQKLPIPPLPGAQGQFFAAPARSLRVQVDVTTENGFKHGREAIIKLPNAQRDHFEVLAWRDLITPMSGPVDDLPEPTPDGPAK
jgi:general secretion pathway protein K